MDAHNVQAGEHHVYRTTADLISLTADNRDSVRGRLIVLPGLAAIMSLLLETSLGDIVIDLEVEACPKTSENFLKLCKVYYYNLNAFFNGSFSLQAHHLCCLNLVL